ncbi:hypothetical protein GS399_00865 [Pedobacter sp. HMF7647]|uniref:Uncharacterized protein n=1 Tax=Hufsiella arboris TaxID=2695275 RepID=A0A7K1Y4K0_9SPHI|nr:hypothetical protein [Hufsiella arboris]MXV49507.1 hypothetical protein [Hufsiella arboris]
MKHHFTIFFLFIGLISFGQTKPTESLASQLKADIGFEGIGLSYEPKLLNQLTIQCSGGIGGYYSVSESSFDYDLNPTKPAFFVSVNPKFFIAQKTRALKSKDTRLNSGNYMLSALSKLILDGTRDCVSITKSIFKSYGQLD